jgi:DNA-binding NarL/FixJ family response regulator
MQTRRLRLLLVVTPGPVAVGLRAVLSGLRDVEVAWQVDDLLAALRVVVAEQPDEVVIELAPYGERAVWLVQGIKAIAPQIRCIVLADDVEQQRVAACAGADHMLLKGCRVDELIAVVEGMPA